MTHYDLHVSVVIPTYKRPDGLSRAIESVLAQSDVDWDTAELLVVDNDPDCSARDTVARFGNACVTVRYVSEPNPGVANARNKAVRSVRGRLMAFLDDDQTAPPQWLSRILANFETYGAPVTFGPVETALPASDLPHSEYLNRFFSRIGPAESCLSRDYWGCGNSLFDLGQMPDDGELFDVKGNETGGEDDFLFTRLQADGAMFGWAADASVFEHVPANRANLKYTLRRTFAYGQSPTTLAAYSSPPDVPKIIFWTLAGLVQSSVYGLGAALMFIARAPRRAFWYDKAVQGLGKMFWFGPFEQKFYGRHAV